MNVYVVGGPDTFEDPYVFGSVGDAHDFARSRWPEGYALGDVRISELLVIDSALAARMIAEEQEEVIS